MEKTGEDQGPVLKTITCLRDFVDTIVFMEEEEDVYMGYMLGQYWCHDKLQSHVYDTKLVQYFMDQRTDYQKRCADIASVCSSPNVRNHHIKEVWKQIEHLKDFF